jgi:lysophospholipase L1-like esterase
MKRTLSATLALGIAACTGSSDNGAASADSALVAGGEILALGDSITYGYDPNLQPEGAPFSRYKSYADALATGTTTLTNAACTGEASGSFFDVSAPNNGCHQDENEKSFKEWLKVPWNAPTQAEFTKNFLRGRVAENKPPKLVVLTLGGNDLFLVLEDCSFLGCTSALNAAVVKYRANMKRLFDLVESTGYAGIVAIPNTYALDYGSTLEKLALNKLNKALDAAAEDARHGLAERGSTMRIVVADVFSSFEKATNSGSSCKAGLLLPGGDDDDDDDDDDDKEKNEKDCDVHPSAEGHTLIASTITDALK